MADYYPLIARAVAGLEKNTGDARRALYERARTALVAQLRSVKPPLSENDVTRERLALEEAIRKVEAEAARKGWVDPASRRRADARARARIPALGSAAAPAPRMTTIRSRADARAAARRTDGVNGRQRSAARALRSSNASPPPPPPPPQPNGMLGERALRRSGVRPAAAVGAGARHAAAHRQRACADAAASAARCWTPGSRISATSSPRTAKSSAPLPRVRAERPRASYARHRRRPRTITTASTPARYDPHARRCRTIPAPPMLEQGPDYDDAAAAAREGAAGDGASGDGARVAPLRFGAYVKIALIAADPRRPRRR